MNYPFFSSTSEKPSKLIVFLHGLGSDGDDLISVVPYIQPALPECYFISPHGVYPYDMGPYGRQWFSLRTREPHIIYKELEQAIPKIIEIIQAKLDELNLTLQDTFLVGFSQGTMTALYLALSSTESFAAVIGFSGALILPQNIKQTTTPICLIHGQMDEVVTFENLNIAEKKLKELGIPIVETFAIPQLGHSIDMNGLKYATDFIRKHIR